MSNDSPNLGTVIRQALDSRLIDVHTAMPGRVTAYDREAQTADVKPQAKRVIRKRNGERVAEDLPVLPCVPVQWPRAGGYFVHLPMGVGDTGLIVFNEYTIDRWRSTGNDVDPGDARRHSMSGAVFIPGIAPTANAIGDNDAGKMTFGADGDYVAGIDASGVAFPKDAVEFLARADRVLANLNLIATTFNIHQHPANNTPPTPLIPGPLAPVASDTVKGT